MSSLELDSRGLQRLIDRAAIEETLIRYAMGVDAGDFELIRSCFAPNVQAIYNGVRLDGIDGILQSAGVARKYASTTHIVSNIMAEIEGSYAEVESRVIVAMAQDPQREDALIKVRGACNRDHFVRQQGAQWLIGRRVLTIDWMFETRSLPTQLQNVKRPKED